MVNRVFIVKLTPIRSSASGVESRSAAMRGCEWRHSHSRLVATSLPVAEPARVKPEV